MRNISKVLLLFFLFSFQNLIAQQVSKISFAGSGEPVYVKPLNKVFLRGYVDNFLNSGIYSYDMLSHQLLKENSFDSNDQLRMSPDEQFLYVSNTENVTVYNLPSLSVAYQFTAPDIINGNFKISPLDPNLILIRGSTTLSLYQNGVKLPNIVSNGGTHEYIFSETKNMIYTKDNGSSANGFIALSFDNNGINPPDKNYFFHLDDSFLTLYKDKIYSLEGSVIDVTNPIPKLEGQHTIRLQNLLGSGSYTASYNISKFNATLLDTAKNQFIQVGTNPTDGRLILLYYDMERLVLMDTKIIDAPLFGSTFSKQYLQYADGANFMYYSNNAELIIVKDECTSTAAAPTLDPIYQNPVYYCQPNPIFVTPPAGYDAVYDADNVRRDTLVIEGQGAYQYRVMDAQGCLSELSDTIVVKASFMPLQPYIQVLGNNDFSQQTTVERCQDGKIYFQAYINGFGVESFLWSTGEIEQEIAVENDTEVWVRAVSEFGCMSEPSNTVQITNVNKPSPEPPKIFGDDLDTNICSTSSVKLIGEEGYERYRWYNYTNNYYVTSSTFTINDESHVYLQGKNADGCWSDFSHVHVKEVQDNVSIKPQISQLDNLLSSNSPATHFQWFYNNEAIPDSNNPVLETTQSGTYHLKIGDGLCWSLLSDPVIIP